MILLFNFFISNDICQLINFFIYTGSKKIKLIFLIHHYTFYFYRFFLVIIEYSINITLTLSQKLVKKRIQDSSGFKCKASNMSCQHSIHCQLSQCIVSPPLVWNSSPDSTHIEKNMLLKLRKLQRGLLVPLDLNVSYMYLEKKLWLNQDFWFVNPCL